MMSEVIQPWALGLETQVLKLAPGVMGALGLAEKQELRVRTETPHGEIMMASKIGEALRISMQRNNGTYCVLNSHGIKQ